MRPFPFLLLLLLPAVLLAGSHRDFHRKQSAFPSTILGDVSVVDVAAGRIAPHRDIVIANGRISRIRPAAGRGRVRMYVIPALWDMEAHVSGDDPDFEMYVAGGVASVRETGGDLKRMRAVQARISKGEIAGPRIYACGTAVSGAPEPAESRIPVTLIRTPGEARRAFDAYYNQRVDFIRVLDMDPRSFEALAERSRQDGIPFAGFVPDSVPASVAAKDRMVSMEHLSGIGLACSWRQDELRAKLIAARANDDVAAIRMLNREIEDSYDPSTAASLFDLLRRYGVPQTPSLAWWSRNRENPGEYEFAAKLTREMARAGVAILAGSDGGPPGIELHRELELLVAAGLSPADALRAATLEPARLMRREDSGEVKPGFAADLVILRANPLASISNTRAIEEVLVRGKRFDRETRSPAFVWR